jgi:hypothetical protein
MYGYFTHGTDPPPRPYSSGFFFLPDLLRLLPSPTHSVADFSVTSFRLLQVPRSSPTTGRAPFPTSLPLIGSLSSGATEDPASPPEVTPDSSVPCRPQSPCFWWVNENAFASIQQARPCPTLGRPVHLRGGAPRLRPGTSPHALRIPPHGGHPALRVLQSGGSRSALAVSDFRLRARLGFSIPSPLPADEELPPPLDTALLIRAPEGLEPS